MIHIKLVQPDEALNITLIEASSLTLMSARPSKIEEKSRGRERPSEMATHTCFAASSTVVGLGTSTLSRSSAKSIPLTSGFLRPHVVPRNPLRLVGPPPVGKFTCSFERNWLRTDYNVIGFGLIGWIAPSSIPAINGNSLTGLFFSSIGQELSHFPTGPALTSDFWLWMVLWHLGLFLCLTFGQIGFKGRADGYF